jgi:predicted ATPase
MPVQPTALIGREAEIAVVQSMLSSPAEPIVTLTGPGGMGKTRLALQVGAEMVEHFEHGVFFVDLSLVEEPDLMPAAIGHSLNLKESGNRPYMAILTEFLKDRHILLILDNLEQILASRDQIVTLTGACGGAKVIVTSREALRVRGEKVFNVPPLALPDIRPDARQDIETTSQYEAVRLFIERARAAKQDFRISNSNAPAVAEICVRLDGIPLAIELAAARIRMLSPDAILARLEHSLSLLKGGMNDLPVRQQALRATIDWSYNMLDDEHKRLFRDLSVFKGGFTLDAAELVFTDTPEDADLFQGIESLVDKSFVFPEDTGTGEPRFHLLETMREYGIEKLKEEGTFESLHDRHAGYYKSLVAALCPSLRGRELKGSLDQLDEDYGNIRDALSWLHIQDKSEHVLEICGQIWRFWQIRGHLTEGREQIERALLLGEDAEPRLIAPTLLGAGDLAREQGDYKGALASLRRAFLIYKEEKSNTGLMNSYRALGWVHFRLNAIEAAQKAFATGDRLATVLGDDYQRGLIGIGLGAAKWRLGLVTEADEIFAQCRVLFHNLGDSRREAQVLCNLGILARKRGHFPRALELYRCAEGLLAKIDDQATLRGVYNNIGDICLLMGSIGTSKRYYEQLRDLATSMCDLAFEASAGIGLAEIELHEGNPEKAAVLSVRPLDIANQTNDRVAQGVCLRVQGESLILRGQTKDAIGILEESVTVLENIHFEEELQKARYMLREARENREPSIGD